MISLTDTHTHIYYAPDERELHVLMERCRNHQVDRLILPNVDVESIDPVFRTVSLYPEHCFAMLGLHPCSVKDDYADQLDTIKKKIDQHMAPGSGLPPIYAIGEIGLDLYWDKSTLKWQQEAFRRQADWAKELGLPVSIHCREAYDELFEMLEEVQDGRLTGVLHCFTGTVEQAWKTIGFGLHLGIGGVVTFKNSGLDQVVRQIPLQHLVLETDAPYLAPAPYRGKQNESSYLLIIAEKVADLHGISLGELAEKTSANADRIFRLPAPITGDGSL